MAIATECPLCATKGQVPDSYNGKRVKCPQCCNLFTVTGTGGSSSGGKGANGSFPRVAAKTQQELILPGPGIRPTGGSKPGTPIQKTGKSLNGTTKPTAGSHAGNSRPTSGSNAGNNRPTSGSYSGRPSSKPSIDARPRGNLPALLLGIGGVFFGIVGLTLGLVPDTEAFGWPVSALGVLMALAGLVLSLIRLRGFGFPIAGAFTAGGALCLALLLPSSPEEQKKKELEKAGNDLAKLVTNLETPTSRDNPLSTKNTPATTKKYVPPPPADEWTDASKGFARIGEVRVRVSAAEVGPVKGKDGKVLPMMDKQLVIRLQIENGSVLKKLTYKGAADPAARTGNSTPRLTDSTGGKFQPVAKGPPVAGQVATTTVDPFKSVNDLLIFPPPSDKAQFLRLELPGSQFGATGSVKMQIPSSMVVVRTTTATPPVTDPKSIDTLRAALKGKDRNAKLDAVTKLGDAGPKAGPAVGEMALVLRDPDPALREAAALALGKLGATAKSAVNNLAAALKDAQPKVRAQAAQSLGQLGAEARPALDDLIAAFADPDDDVANKAFQAVKRIEAPPMK